MIDLHAHILPGLDDGSQSLRESLEMARMAAQSGVRAMVVTPHCTDSRARAVRASVARLRSALEDAQIPLKLYEGMEIFGTGETAYLLQEERLLTLNRSRYPLIEFPFQSNGDIETEILNSVLEAGYRPVVAHPERYRYVQREPALMNLWQKMGCLFQINRGSLLGRFGYEAQKLALALVDRGFATAVASDAHSSHARTPWMQDIKEFLTEEFSPVAAEYLLRRNPGKIINNEPLAYEEPEWF